MPIVNVNHINIWYESFGKKQDNCILLIMGGCCQGILWPTEFCEQLANEGFYVIRYDHRDTGQSTYFDYQKNPYTIEDMADDAIGLLDFMQINRCQLIGLSMGGPIAELISVKQPKRISAITLIASSCDFRPMNLAYAGLPDEKNSLSRTKDIYLDWMQRFMSFPPKNEEEHIQLRVEGWKILSGFKVPFDQNRHYELHKEYLQRALHPESHLNHIRICQTAEEIIKKIPYQVSVPAVVIHGTEDTIFPPDHGAALAKAIQNSKFILVEGLGHVPNSHFYKLIINSVATLN